MKKAQFYERAEQMYVAGDMTFEEIARQLDLGEKTVRLWAAEGKWHDKRGTFRVQRESLDDKLYTFTTRLMDSIQADWDAQNQVDPGRLYALTRLVDKLEKARKFEAETKRVEKDAEEQAREASNDAIQKKVEELLGLH